MTTMTLRSAQKRHQVVHQSAPGKLYSQPNITGDGQKIQVVHVNELTYLRSALSRAIHIADEVTARPAIACLAFGRLRAKFWERNGIRIDTKPKVYKAVVLTTLLYACM